MKFSEILGQMLKGNWLSPSFLSKFILKLCVKQDKSWKLDKMCAFFLSFDQNCGSTDACLYVKLMIESLELTENF